jgi:hypothetical protein
MPKSFAIKFITTALVEISGGKRRFISKRDNSPSDGVYYTDQVLALAPSDAMLLHYSSVALTPQSPDLIKYGYVLHAGEPAFNADTDTPDRTIVKLVIGATAAALDVAGPPSTWRTVMTFEYPQTDFFHINEAGEEVRVLDYDGEGDPETYPDIEPDPTTSLPDFEDITDPDTSADDATEPDPDDTDEESSGAEGSDCDGIIGIFA